MTDHARKLTINHPIADLLFRRCKLSQDETLKLAAEVVAIADAGAELRAENERLTKAARAWDSVMNVIESLSALPDAPEPDAKVNAYIAVYERMKGELAELTRERDWLALLAQAAIVRYGNGSTMLSQIKEYPEGCDYGFVFIRPPTGGCFEFKSDFANGLPVESPELRHAIEAAIGKE